MFRLGNLRLWNVFRKRRLEQDLNSELQTHLDLLIDENIRRGCEQRHKLLRNNAHCSFPESAGCKCVPRPLSHARISPE